MKQEQQENAKLVEQNKGLEEDLALKQHTIYDLESKNMFILGRITKSE